MRGDYVYRERQIGWLILVAVGLACAFVFGLAWWREPSQLRGPLGWLAVAMALVAIGMGSLTIEVGGGELRWRFGWLGWPGGRIPLADIARVEPCQTRWHEGWGIRITRDGMLYNVSGFDAVQVTRRDGRRFRLGCTDPAAVVRVLAPRL